MSSEKYFFSINLLIKSDSHLEKSITSILSNEAFFKDHIQLLLINSVGSDFTHEICSKYIAMYPENIHFVDTVGKSNADGYNDARPICSGQYISFIDNYGEYSKNTFPELYKLIKNGKIPVVCIQPLISPPGEPVRQYVSDIKQGIVRLRDTPDRFILMPGCYFFNRKVIKNIFFDPKLVFHGETKFITDTLLKTYSYIFIEKVNYTSSNASELDFFRYEPQYSRTYYIKSVNDFIIPMLKSYFGSVLVQSIMMYLINIKFSLNADDRYKNVIIGRYVDEFIHSIADALQYIDDTIIMGKRLCRICGLDPEVPFRFLRLKYDDPDLKPVLTASVKNEPIERSFYKMNGHSYKLRLENEFVASVNKVPIQRSKDITAEIVAINYDAEGLYVDAYMEGCGCLDENDYTIYTVINRKRYEVIRSKVYTLRKFFDIPFLNKYSFRFFIPVSSGKQIDTAFLIMKIGELSLRLNLGFHHTFSRLSGELENSYWRFNDRVMTYDHKTSSIIIRRATDSLIALYENKYLNEIAKELSIAETLHYRQMRKAVRYAMSDKRVKNMMFYDEMGINCNGNLLFRYFTKYQKSDMIHTYFSVQNDSVEQAFLFNKEYENVLETGSKKSKIMAMASDVIIATDCDVYEALAFTPHDILYCKDLLNAKIISIKNFFLTYDTAQFDNRLRDNTQAVFCSSEQEKERLVREIYDYDPSMIKVLGYPILDSVKDHKEKLILIAPGDRKQFYIYENAHYYHFSDSRFFKTYNSILTDVDLLNAMKASGYKIAVLMPRTIKKYIKMFTADEEVVTLYEYTEENEIKLIERAAVLLTDYSELQYRFAYLNKPVVYFYPQNLPIQQEYKEQKISKNGFGEIVYNIDQLKEFLIRNAKRNFMQPLRFERRCQEFFRYMDGDNCGRIMNEIVNSFFPDIPST